MRLYKLLMIGAFVFAFSSCDKQIDLIPQQQLDVKGAFIDRDATFSTLLGVYNSCQVLEVSGGMPQIISDFMSDNSSFVGSFPTFQDIRDFNTISTNANIQTLWQFNYQVIARANDVIDAVPNVPGAAFTAAEKAQFIAEAKFLRAYVHFQLVTLFAQPYNFSNGSNLGIPLVITPFKGTVTFPARNTVAEVYAQVIKDLTEAIPDLPATYSTAIFTRGRATQGSAQALLSRVYLYKGDYANAATNAKLVLDASGTYSPAADYSFWTSKNTSEDVFTIQNSAIDNGRTGTGGWAAWHRPAANGGRGDVKFSPTLVAAYTAEPGDLRYSLKSTGTGADNNPATFITKWSDAVNNGDNSPVIRTTEVVLNYVEAKAEVDGAVSQNLIDRMNVLRTRAGLTNWTLATFATKAAFVDGVLNERWKELAFEGHRRMDLLRRGKDLRTGDPKAAFGADKTILPIPQREIDVNPSLQGNQNPGF